MAPCSTAEPPGLESTGICISIIGYKAPDIMKYTYILIHNHMYLKIYDNELFN